MSNIKSKIFVYRNCFTGDLAGGDVRMGGICDWIVKHRPQTKLYLVHAVGDGQDAVYPEMQHVPSLTYPEFKIGGSAALLFLVRAFLGAWRVTLPWSDQKNILVASSHFLPDVLPVYFKGKRAAKVKRAVYIHHIVQDMKRPKTFNTRLANWQEKLCFRLIKRRFDNIIVINNAVADRLKQMGFKRQTILLSSSFVSIDNPQPKPYAQKDITVIFCGRMVRQKGVDDFVQVCESLQHTIPHFNAVMMGVGPELERIKQLVESKRLNVQVTGFVDDDKKFAQLSRAKLFVFPSVEEGWGMAIAEALAVGTPVVAYDLPVYQLVFEDQLEYCRLGQPRLLAQKTVDLLRLYAENPTFYAQKQQAITAYTKRFMKEEMAAREYDFLTA